MDLNVRLETIKLLEENMRRTLFDIRLSNIFVCPLGQIKIFNKHTYSRNIGSWTCLTILTYDSHLPIVITVALAVSCLVTTS